MFAATIADATDPDSMLLPGHDVPLGRYTTVRRLLPVRQRRMIGAWCFVDHFGPDRLCSAAKLLTGAIADVGPFDAFAFEGNGAHECGRSVDRLAETQSHAAMCFLDLVEWRCKQQPALADDGHLIGDPFDLIQQM